MGMQQLAVSFIALLGITYPPLKTLWDVEAIKVQQGAMQHEMVELKSDVSTLKSDVSKILALLERRK